MLDSAALFQPLSESEESSGTTLSTVISRNTQMTVQFLVSDGEEAEYGEQVDHNVA